MTPPRKPGRPSRGLSVEVTIYMHPDDVAEVDALRGGDMPRGEAIREALRWALATGWKPGRTIS